MPTIITLSKGGEIVLALEGKKIEDEDEFCAVGREL
jgi:hypothetical protein